MRIAIIGLGLIGGSIGLALKNWSKTEEGQTANVELVGFDAKGKQRSLAEKMNVCHRYVATPMDAVKDADLVIVATPVMAVRETFEDIKEHLKPGAIVTDTCSTKRQVMNWAKELLPTTVSFVGGHPMAGKTASLEQADAALFKDCTYCLMAAPGVPEEAIENVTRLVNIFGANAYFMDPAEHDSYTAAISHLPYLTSVGLVNLAGSSPGWREMSRLASTGFKDTTRLAGGNLAMHVDICRTNSDSIINWIDRYQQQLTQLRKLIEEAGLFDERGRPKPESLSDVAPLEQYLSQAVETRERWQASRKQPLQDERSGDVAMPTTKEIRSTYSRMLFGGLFTKRSPRSDDPKNPSGSNNTPGKS
jgi:prephenate dehydrogenase